MSGRKTTMKDVARLAGVTQPTVSYVLNGTASISDEVKERVLKAVEELNYRPNYNAVALKKQRSNVVGVVIPDITNAFYSGMVSGLEKELSRRGYQVLISSTGYKEKVETEILNRILDHNAEAVIVAYELGNPEGWKLLRDSGKHVIAIEAGKAGREFNDIDTDNYFGAYTATEHLFKEGRKHVVYVGQEANIEALANREKGYIDAVKNIGIQKEPVIFRTDVPDEKWEAGRKIGRSLAEDKEIDGILVSSDLIAVGIIKSLISSGIRIPEDISLIGYDDIPIAKLYIPELSTVSQPLGQICIKAAEMIDSLLNGNDIDMDTVTLSPELILRETTIYR